jgi:hypothetical protein
VVEQLHVHGDSLQDNLREVASKVATVSSAASKALSAAATVEDTLTVAKATQPKNDDPINLPGGAGHKILSLSDEQFRNIPVNEQMSWYGQADGGGSCANDFGNDLITRWRATKQAYCPANRVASSGPDGGTDTGEQPSGTIVQTIPWVYVGMLSGNL